MRDRFGRDADYGRDDRGWDEREGRGERGWEERYGGPHRGWARDEHRTAGRDLDREGGRMTQRIYGGAYPPEAGRFSSRGRDVDRDDHRGFGGDYGRGYGRDVDRGYGGDYDRGYGRDYGRGCGRDFSGDYGRGYGDYDRRFGGDYGREEHRGFGRDQDRGYGQESSHDLGRTVRDTGRSAMQSVSGALNSLGERVRSAFGRGPKGYKRSDGRILEDICERLSDRGDIDVSDVTVRVQNSEVTLEGTVTERHHKRIVEQIAEDVRGVDDVHNQIRVKRATDTAATSGMTTTSATTATSGAATTSPQQNAPRSMANDVARR